MRHEAFRIEQISLLIVEDCLFSHSFGIETNLDVSSMGGDDRVEQYDASILYFSHLKSASSVKISYLLILKYVETGP